MCNYTACVKKDRIRDVSLSSADKADYCVSFSSN